MKLVWILDDVTDALGKVKIGGRKSDPKLAALDRGVLAVALLLAALDGTILPEEYAAIETIAKRCRGGSAKNVRALLDATLKEVGGLMAMANAGVFDERERLAEFRKSARRMLPLGFSSGSLADLRRAFALWVAVGVSDGTFSPIERAAVRELERQYATVRKGRLGGRKTVRLLEGDYLEKVERIVREMASPARRAKAEDELKGLVGTVKVVNTKGRLIVKIAAGIAIKAAVMALLAL